MKNDCSEYYDKHMKRFTDGELWEIVETGRENVNIARVTDEVMEHIKTEYSSHSFVEVVDEENRNDWILVTRSRIGK